jgi:hypothetical protein
MMRTDDDAEDSRGLLSARWNLKTDEKKTRSRPWEMWVIAFICLLVGMAAGAILGGARKGSESSSNSNIAETSEGPSVPMAPFGM